MSNEPHLWDIRLEQAEEALRDCDLLDKSGGSGRALVNRAYYAAFYALLALLAALGEKPRKHGQAIGIFDREFVKTGKMPKECSRQIHSLFRSRNVNDYESLTPMPNEDAEAAVRDAGNFVGVVRIYLADLEKER